VNKSYTDEIKAAEENKRKNYRCVCWIRQPSSDRAAGDEAQSILTAGVSADDLKTILDSQPEITVHQNTPIRVLHRRAVKSHKLPI
jgi:tRNA U54 and U55 pseudouridine synthase Pus10